MRGFEFDNPKDMCSLLVYAEYPRHEIVEAIVQTYGFDEASASRLTTETMRRYLDFTDDEDARIERERMAALAAELSLGPSRSGPGGETGGKMEDRIYNVYVPRDGSHEASTIDAKSAIIGSPAEEWLGHVERSEEATSTLLVIDYEGNRYGSTSMVTFADRCVHAAGRHEQHYPTVARRAIRGEELELVAKFHARAERVEPVDARGLYLLAKWIGMPLESWPNGSRYDGFAAELRGTSVRAAG